MISNAYAQTAQASGGDTILGLLPIFAMFILLYFLMIRPQMKKAKEQKTMVDSLQKGDEVITGPYVTVSKELNSGDKVKILDLKSKK